MAHAGGFTLMTAYVAWSAVEPTRGQYVFEQHDQWGRIQANDLSNVVDAARNNGLRVGLRLDSPPDWAGGAVYKLDPSDVEDYVFHAVRYAAGALGYVEVFNEMNLPLEWGTTPVDPAAYARILAGAYRGATPRRPERGRRQRRAVAAHRRPGRHDGRRRLARMACMTLAARRRSMRWACTRTSATRRRMRTRRARRCASATSSCTAPSCSTTATAPSAPDHRVRHPRADVARPRSVRVDGAAQ